MLPEAPLDCILLFRVRVRKGTQRIGQVDGRAGAGRTYTGAQLLSADSSKPSTDSSPRRENSGKGDTHQVRELLGDRGAARAVRRVIAQIWERGYRSFPRRRSQDVYDRGCAREPRSVLDDSSRIRRESSRASAGHREGVDARAGLVVGAFRARVPFAMDDVAEVCGSSNDEWCFGIRARGAREPSSSALKSYAPVAHGSYYPASTQRPGWRPNGAVRYGANSCSRSLHGPGRSHTLSRSQWSGSRPARDDHGRSYEGVAKTSIVGVARSGETAGHQKTVGWVRASATRLPLGGNVEDVLMRAGRQHGCTCGPSRATTKKPAHGSSGSSSV